MAEIKSAIELAMEKTKDLHLSREEMAKMKEEEMKAKAHGLVHRFLEVDFHLREAEKELQKLSSAQRERMEKLMLEDLFSAIKLDQDNDLIFQGIETLKKGSRKVIVKIQGLIKNFQEQKEKAYQRTEKILLGQLEKKGISGSAVQVKVEGSREWEEALSQFKPAGEEKLQALREELIV